METTFYHDSSSPILVLLDLRAKIGKETFVARTGIFKLDTGASRTCMPADALSTALTEEMFQGEKSYSFTGIDGKSVTYYKLQLERLTVSGMDFGSFPVYVTFNPNAKKLLLGMDVIKFLDISICNSRNEVTLSQTPRFLYWKETYNGCITDPEMLDADIDWTDLVDVNLELD